MEKAQLYFLSDQYYMDFPDGKLMKNKETTDGVPHNRPCFFAFSDSKHPEIYWIIPISSKYEKFKKIAEDKTKKYGHCNTVRFGTVLGWNTAFLIQNMCPTTEDYLTTYIGKNDKHIRLITKSLRSFINYFYKKVGQFLLDNRHLTFRSAFYNACASSCLASTRSLSFSQYFHEAVII